MICAYLYIISTIFFKLFKKKKKIFFIYFVHFNFHSNNQIFRTKLYLNVSALLFIISSYQCYYFFFNHHIKSIWTPHLNTRMRVFSNCCHKVGKTIVQSHVSLQFLPLFPLNLSKVGPGQNLDGRLGKTRPAGGAHPVVCGGPNAPVQ